MTSTTNRAHTPATSFPRSGNSQPNLATLDRLRGRRRTRLTALPSTRRDASTDAAAVDAPDPRP